MHKNAHHAKKMLQNLHQVKMETLSQYSCSSERSPDQYGYSFRMNNFYPKQIIKAFREFTATYHEQSLKK